MKGLKPVYDAIAEAWNVFRTKPMRVVKQFSDELSTTDWVVDLGCGTGRNFPALKGHEFVGVDFSIEMARFAKQKHDKVIVADLRHLPFKKEVFSAALLVSVINHFDKPPWREVRRVLKPGGLGLVVSWNPEQERFSEWPKKRVFYVPWKWKGKTYKRYYHLFSVTELEKQVENASFKVLKYYHEGTSVPKNLSIKIQKSDLKKKVDLK